MGVFRNKTRHKGGVPASYHTESKKAPGRCGACGQAWPCSTAVRSANVCDLGSLSSDKTPEP